VSEALAQQLSSEPRTALRLGFAGAGWIGRMRMRSLLDDGGAVVAAVADPSSQAREQARALAPGAQLVEDFDALLALELDGIVIATPSGMHAAQSIAALERGIAVFCEKPLGCSAREARRIVSAARDADRLLEVDYAYRHTRAARALRKLVRTGELGSVYALQLTFHNAYGPDQPWFYDRRTAGGGCVVDLGTHLVDLALWLLDFPAVTAVASRVLHQGTPLSESGHEVEDFALVQLELSNGAAVQLQCSWRAHAGRDAVIEAALHGTRGGAAMRNVAGSFYDFEALRFRGTTAERLIEPPDEWGGRALNSWVSELRRSPRFRDEAERFVEVAHVLDAIYRGGLGRAREAGT
jgi:predicted dehydrogenase